MRPESKSEANCRRKLQDKFEPASASPGPEPHPRKVLSVLTLNDTRKALRSGAEKLSKTLSSVRTTIGNFSQRFKSSTKRRQILEEGPATPNCSTPRVRSLLGRTPTKLYSPFGIETPRPPLPSSVSDPSDKENAPPAPGKRALDWTRKKALLDDVC